MAQRVLSFHYVLTGDDGNVIDSSRESQPLSIIEGAGQIIPGLESQITEMNVGDKQDVTVVAEQAYGKVREELVIQVNRAELPEGELQVGIQFRGGEEAHSPIFTVIKIEGDDVTLDGNHPLAGKDLKFEIEMMEIREATAEELEHGHAHGPGGHQH